MLEDIGRNTLAVYLFQYFFVNNLSMHINPSQWNWVTDSWLIEFTIVFTVSCVITALRLLVAEVLKLFKPLRILTLGQAE